MNPEIITEVVSQFSSNLKEIYGSSLREVILYGSCARGDFSPDSDIDVFVLMDVPQDRLPEEQSRVMDAADRLDLAYDVVLTPVLQTVKNFTRYLPVSQFYQTIRDEGVRYA